MALLLGIDTGGTYTDAVLLSDDNGVFRTAKALTTKYDLSIGIRQAVEQVLPHPPPEIHMVSLSTTLATNAIVEAHGSPICLLLLGYPPDVLDQEGLREALGSNPVVFIGGGHAVDGEEQMPLDIDAVRKAIRTHAPQVAAFAVSGYFAVRNPAHEIAVRELIRNQTGLPVTCGHELTSNLHAARRALTAALNACLIPLLHQLILAIRGMLDERSIHAPLMVVKGDGSLIDAQVALERPVETILSGPAASVAGARYLSGEDDVLVVDMGGTTTDVALLREGRPVLDSEGASVGGWRTMVEAVAVHTFGLGGDSEVRLNDAGEVLVGPRRVVPLSLLAHQHPELLPVLRRQRARGGTEPSDGQFVLRQRPLDAGGAALTPAQAEIWDALADGALPLQDLLHAVPIPLFREWAVSELVERGLAVLSGFTPTDAAHVLGYQDHWAAEAARLGAELWARRASELSGGAVDTPEEFAQRVMRQVTVQAGRALVATVLAETDGTGPASRDGACRGIVDRALGPEGTQTSLLDISFTLRRRLVAVGAPVSTFYPEVARRLHTQLSIPRHAEIANAIGAVAGGIMQKVHALIKPLDSDGVTRVHLPTGMRDFDNREEAVSYAAREASLLAEGMARRAGAADVQVQVYRRDHSGRSRDGEVYLDTELTVIAVGRPGLASLP